MKNSKIISRVVTGATALLCAIVTWSMLVLEEQSLVADLVYAGF